VNNAAPSRARLGARRHHRRHRQCDGDIGTITGGAAGIDAGTLATVKHTGMISGGGRQRHPRRHCRSHTESSGNSPSLDGMGEDADGPSARRGRNRAGVVSRSRGGVAEDAAFAAVMDAGISSRLAVSARMPLPPPPEIMPVLFTVAKRAGIDAGRPPVMVPIFAVTLTVPAVMPTPPPAVPEMVPALFTVHQGVGEDAERPHP